MALTRIADRSVIARLARRAFRQLVASVAATLTIAAAPAFAQEARSLDWTAFTVDARLDSTGTLVVREKQTILFTGDWNGGERRFDVRLGQRFTFRRLLRVDSLTGAEVPMREGALDEVDGYRMTEGHTLRWRSRLSTDPAFVNTKITYVLEYEYADILLTEGTAYRIDHEFGFRDRPGKIANFDLTLQLDPAWRAPATFTGTFHQQLLQPGTGYVVNIPLIWRGAGVPSAVRRSPPQPQRLGLAAALLLAIVVMTATFLRDETAVGRFAPLTPIERIDRAWLDAHLLSLPPELVGYAWDEEVGAPEVSAILARLVNEKKLASRVDSTDGTIPGSHVLHLEMLVPRHQFDGYDRTLINKLFKSNATVTNTDDIKERFKSTGFDPSALIRQPLIEAFTQATGMAPETTPPPRRWPVTVALSVIGVALVIVGIVTRRADTAVSLLGLALVGLPLFMFARLQAYFWQRRLVAPGLHLLRSFVPMALLAAVLCWGLVTGFGMLGMVASAGLSVLLIAAHRSVLNGSRATGTKKRLLLRKQLASAREYCRAELQKAQPALDDSWYPYLIAFGLGRHVEKWFAAFGGETSARRSSGSVTTTTTTHRSDDSGSGSSSGSFGGFGGGGGFSGAGATVAFGSAVGAMSSGVSAPSSSSSGGGSSSSGGSSGGGGGGGW